MGNNVMMKAVMRQAMPMLEAALPKVDGFIQEEIARVELEPGEIEAIVVIHKNASANDVELSICTTDIDNRIKRQISKETITEFLTKIISQV